MLLKERDGYAGFKPTNFTTKASSITPAKNTRCVYNVTKNVNTRIFKSELYLTTASVV
jgi:hypothetical protein